MITIVVNNGLIPLGIGPLEREVWHEPSRDDEAGLSGHASDGAKSGNGELG
jgi:hypothetical protein